MDIKRKFSLLAIFTFIFLALFSNSSTVSATEQSTSLDTVDYFNEVSIIYSNLIKYDNYSRQFYIDEQQTREYYSTNEEFQGIVALKEVLNSRLGEGISAEEVLNESKNNMIYILEGNDTNHLVPKYALQVRSSSDPFIPCLMDSFNIVGNFSLAREIANLYKAGMYDALAAKVIAAVGLKTLTMAAILARVTYCAFIPIPVS